jgi:hypothetical protein
MLLVTSSLFTSYTERSISRERKRHIRDRDKKNNRTHGNISGGGDIASSLPAFINSLIKLGLWTLFQNLGRTTIASSLLENKVLREISGPERDEVSEGLEDITK